MEMFADVAALYEQGAALPVSPLPVLVYRLGCCTCGFCRRSRLTRFRDRRVLRRTAHRGPARMR